MMKNISSVASHISSYEDIFFDLDNTLYREYDYDLIVFEKYFDEYEVSNWLEPAPLHKALAEFKQSAAYGSTNVFDQFCKKFDVKFDIKKLVSFRRFLVTTGLTESISSIWDEHLEILCRDHNVYIVTNGYTTMQLNKLTMLGFERFSFKKIMILDPLMKHDLKPRVSCLDGLDVSDNAIFIGDSLIDREFSIKAGFDFYHIDYEDYLECPR